MINPKPLLSENAKDFMDYAMEVIQAMDGAPEHTIAEQALVHEKLAKLKAYVDVVATSYNETTPAVQSEAVNKGTEPFSGTGHS